MTTEQRTDGAPGAVCGAVVHVVAALGEVIATARTREELVGRSLDVLADALGWPQAEAWVPGADGQLHLAPGTLSLTAEAGHFNRETRPLAFARGVGLPGLAWQCDGVVVLDTLRAVPWYLRRDAAATAGFDAAAAVAVATREGLEFVMAFHGAQVPGDVPVAMLLTVAAAQLRGAWTRLGRDEFAAAQDRIATVAANAGIGLWEWRPGAEHLVANDAMRALLGLGRRAAFPTRTRFLAMIHPEDRPVVERTLRDLSMRPGRRVPFVLEYRVRTRAGAERRLRCQGVLQRSATGGDPVVHAAVHEVTPPSAAADRVPGAP